VADRRVAHLEILAQRVQRQERPDPTGIMSASSSSDEKSRNFPSHARPRERSAPSALVPAPQDTFRPSEEGLGKAAEGHQAVDCLLRPWRIERKLLARLGGARAVRVFDFAEGERVQAPVVIASLQGIAATAKDVHACAARDQKAQPLAVRIDSPLSQRSTRRHLCNSSSTTTVNSAGQRACRIVSRSARRSMRGRAPRPKCPGFAWPWWSCPPAADRQQTPSSCQDPR